MSPSRDISTKTSLKANSKNRMDIRIPKIEWT